RARVALEDARAALGDAGRAGFRGLIIDNFLAALTLQEGRPDEARNIFERTRAAWIDLPPEERSKVNNNDLGMALASMGETDEAQRVVEDDLERAVGLGDDLLVARAHYNLAQISLMRGEFGKATLAYKMCAEVCRRSENTELMLRAWNGLGNALHLSGELEQSIAYYERGLSLHERAGDLRGGAAISVNMGIVETARGRYEAAKDRLVPAVEYLRALDQKTAVDWMALARGLLELGDVLHRQGKDDRAREALEEAREISSRVQRAAPLRFWILATLAEVEISGGRAKQAAELSGMMRPLAARADEKKKVEEIDAAVEAVWPPAEEAGEAGAPWTPEEEEWMKTSEGRSAPAFKRILEINKLISVESDLDYVLKTVLFYALELSGAEAGAVLLVE
ncbi:MAG TPA: tetratricopeptide repeat protein, partial [bacterium]|nr:tetratricopeptide repeat protein [bacterium]